MKEGITLEQVLEFLESQMISYGKSADNAYMAPLDPNPKADLLQRKYDELKKTIDHLKKILGEDGD